MFSAIYEESFTARSLVKIDDYTGEITGYVMNGISRKDALKGIDTIRDINQFIGSTYKIKGITMEQYSQIMRISCLSIKAKKRYWCSIIANSIAKVPTVTISFTAYLYTLLDICKFACLKEGMADYISDLSSPATIGQLTPLPSPIVVPQPSHVQGTLNSCLVRGVQRIVLTTNVQNIAQQPILLSADFPLDFIPIILQWVALILNE